MHSIVQKIHKINQVLSKSLSDGISMKELCTELSEILESNVYLFDETASIKEYALSTKFSCPHMGASLQAGVIPESFMKMYYSNNKGVLNEYNKDAKCHYKSVGSCIYENRYSSLYPIYLNHKKRYGILFVRYHQSFSLEEEVLCEYATSIATIELMHKKQEQIRQKGIEAASLALAISSLSPSEKRAVKGVLEELEGEKGHVFSNNVANKTYNTSSTVTSALKKLEASGVLTSVSRGVKGKYIEITNSNFVDYFYKNF